MKVVIAGAAIRPGWGGGEPVIAREISTGLQSRGFEVVPVPTDRSVGQLVSMAMSPWDWDPYTYLRYISKLEKENPDCVLGFYDYDSSLLRACANLHVPFVASVHIYWPVCPVGTLYLEQDGVCPGPGLSRCLRHMSRAVPPTRLPFSGEWIPAPVGLSIYRKTMARLRELRKAAAIVVPSRRLLEILRGFGLSSICEVPNGMPVESIPAKPWNGGQKRILFASGAASERKGFQHFAEVARLLTGSEPDATFVATSWIGRGAVLGLGRLPHSGVLREMRNSYAVVAPSLWEEPFSVTIQEAMACGKAVVAYDSGGNAELLGDAGVLVPRGDVAALCSALRGLLSDETRAIRLGFEARARAEEMFRSRKMIDGYAQVLEQVT